MKYKYPKTERWKISLLKKANLIMSILADTVTTYRLEIIGSEIHIFIFEKVLNWDVMEPLILMCIEKDISWSVGANMDKITKPGYNMIIKIFPNQR